MGDRPYTFRLMTINHCTILPLRVGIKHGTHLGVALVLQGAVGIRLIASLVGKDRHHIEDIRVGVGLEDVLADIARDRTGFSSTAPFLQSIKHPWLNLKFSN